MFWEEHHKINISLSSGCFEDHLYQATGTDRDSQLFDFLGLHFHENQKIWTNLKHLLRAFVRKRFSKNIVFGVCGIQMVYFTFSKIEQTWRIFLRNNIHQLWGLGRVIKSIVPRCPWVLGRFQNCGKIGRIYQLRLRNMMEKSIFKSVTTLCWTWWQIISEINLERTSLA